MKPISETLLDFFEEEDYCFEQLGGDPVFRIHFKCDNGDFPTIVIVDEEDRMLQISSICPVNITKEKMPVLAELIVRINNYLLLGLFDLHMDGETLEFRLGIKVHRIDLEYEILDLLLSGNSSVMDHFLPIITSVAYGNVSPKKAIQLLKDANDECIQKREEDSVGDKPSLYKRFNGRMGFFSDN